MWRQTFIGWTSSDGKPSSINMKVWLMSISLRIRILLIFGPPNLNKLKKVESEYIFFPKLKESVNPIISRHKNAGIQLSLRSLSSLTLKLHYHLSWNCDMLRIHLFGQNPYESIYGLESEYISFFAIEYEYSTTPQTAGCLKQPLHVKGHNLRRPFEFLYSIIYCVWSLKIIHWRECFT